ncbi:Polyprotein of EF-Ts, chloroplastic [Frankliniella fusca]|uniref:Polyprotein of EF-Ts, chloroplastic n=1 Tax=Frankliniella fusca TaxID=407009 RepID=A0AAE1I1D8_9NEOP|nr:Polyprotein of EF-Ts, chloroplastic [Frankliniella fusca]
MLVTVPDPEDDYSHDDENGSVSNTNKLTAVSFPTASDVPEDVILVTVPDPEDVTDSAQKASSISDKADTEKTPRHEPGQTDNTKLSVNGIPSGVDTPEHKVKQDNIPNAYVKGISWWQELSEFPPILKNQKFRIGKQTIWASSFDSLQPKTFLNDKIFDRFCKEVNAEKNEPFAQIFMLSCQDTEAVVEFHFTEVLHRVTASRACFNDLWIVPIHIDRNHWMLFVVLIAKKTILVLDPLRRKPGPQNKCMTSHLKVRLHFNIFLNCSSGYYCLMKLVSIFLYFLITRY